jgi:hypothetical protein
VSLGRDSARKVPVRARAGRAGAARAATAGLTNDGRDDLWDKVDGTIDALLAALEVGPIPLLPLFAPAATGRLPTTGGVFVLDVDVLVGPPDPNCFVGDLVGDRMPLASLAAGVGVPTIALALLPGPSCCSVCRLVPLGGAYTLLGRALAVALVVGFGFGLTSSSTRLMPEDLQKIP